MSEHVPLLSSSQSGRAPVVSVPAVQTSPQIGGALNESSGGSSSQPRPKRLSASLAGSDEDVAQDGMGMPPRWWQRTWFRQLMAVTLVAAFVGGLLLLEKVNQNINDPAPLPTAPNKSACDHPIYCTGPLLKAVQMANMFPDCKTFVDMAIRPPFTTHEVVNNFTLIQPLQKQNPATWNATLTAFVERYFLPVGTDVMAAGTPPDFNTTPGSVSFGQYVTDERFNIFAVDIYNKWPQLYKAFNLTSLCGSCSSALPVPFPFFVAGGRFREFYYWDTFWILSGLLASGMHSSARSTITNMLSLVAEFGFMPNGARIYYSDRSQPPFLTQMVALYVNRTGDTSLLLEALPALDYEMAFWKDRRKLDITYKGVEYKGLSHYDSRIPEPRPESYREDIATWSQAVRDGREPDSFYGSIRAAAESGQDFSSRWLAVPTELATIRTNAIIPVDLNAILLRNEQLLAEWFACCWRGSSFDASTAASRAAHYNKLAADRERAMLEVLWDPSCNCFRDFESEAQGHLWAANYSGTLVAPFYVPSIAAAIKARFANDTEAWASIREMMTTLAWPGGVAASDIVSGQQWDSPNAWAPDQWFMLEGLVNMYGASDPLVLEVAQRWISNVYCGWLYVGQLPNDGGNFTHMLWEKYNATVANGVPGVGGEYQVQPGFGWTNGLALDLLLRFGTQLQVPSHC